MIVVVDSPSALRTKSAVGVSGLGVAVARDATNEATVVQLVGRVGDDAIGDDVLLGLATAGIGHVAVLRSPGTATPIVAAPDASDEGALSSVLDADSPVD